MNEPQVFTNPDFSSIRGLEIDGTPWFVGKDVALALGYKDTVNALKAHVDDEDKAGWQIATQFGTKETTIINESGVYSLIFSSKLPSAKAFKRWVTHEVIPSIRRTGQYAHPDVQPVTAADYIKAASIVAGCADKRLPIVVDLLRHAGLEINDVIQNGKPPDRRHTRFAKTDADVADQLAACELLRTAVGQFSFTQRQLVRLTGMDKSNISRYIYNERRPTPERARLILSVVADALAAKQTRLVGGAP